MKPSSNILKTILPYVRPEDMKEGYLAERMQVYRKKARRLKTGCSGSPGENRLSVLDTLSGDYLRQSADEVTGFGWSAKGIEFLEPTFEALCKGIDLNLKDGNDTT